MTTLIEHFAAARMPRGHELCGCCEGSGTHDGLACARCEGDGHIRTGSRDPYCPGREADEPREPRRRHWRESALGSRDELPPDPGAVPIPHGHIRLWHYTSLDNADSIRQHGIQRRYARSDAGNGDLSEPSAGVWASTRRPDDLLKDRHSGRAVIEYHASPSQISYQADHYGSQDPEEWARGYHHVIMKGDVHPSQIVGVHEPWHGLARAIKERDPSLQRYKDVRAMHASDPDGGLGDYVRALDALEGHRGMAPREAAIRSVPPEEYGSYHYPDYPPKKLPALAKYFRKHEPDYYAVVHSHIAEHGVQEPVLVRRNDPAGRPFPHPVVMSGHHRAAAAYELGQHVPVGDYDDEEDHGTNRSFGHQWWREHHELKESHPDPRYAARRTAEYEYRMQHQGPGEEDGEALHEIGTKGTYPSDVHQHPDWYGAEHGETMEKLYKHRGRPYSRVTIYRSLPSPHRAINTGDWVATAAQYARDHGRESSPENDWPVVRATVRADQIRSAGDSLEEWSYHGPPVKRAVLHFGGGKNQRGQSGRGRTDSLPEEHEPPEMHQHYSEMASRGRQQRKEWKEKQDAYYQGQGEHPGEFRYQAVRTARGESSADKYDDLDFLHHSQETGGSRHPVKNTIYAIHPEDGAVGSLDYFPPKRSNGRIAIDNLLVHSDHRRRGVASALMDEVQRRHPDASIDHGERTNAGKLWWDGYSSGKPVRRGRTAAIRMRYTTYAPGGGYVDKEQELSGPFYHGSRSRRLKPGDLIRKGMPTNSWGDEGPVSQQVHFTDSAEGARSYAHDAGGYVYEVEPTGDDIKMGYSGSEYRSQHPLRVIRRVP